MPRVRVFISSTIDDLIAERSAVDTSLSETEIFDVVRTETLPAAEQSSRKVCLDGVATTELFVLIVGRRYGFVPPSNNPDQLSVTHLEYLEAKRLGRPVFAFLQDGVEPEEQVANLIKDIEDFNEGVFRKRWESVAALQHEVRRALLLWLLRQARSGTLTTERRALVDEAAKQKEVSTLPLLIEAPICSIPEEWIPSLVDELTRGCQRLLLPRPAVVNSRLDVLGEAALRITIRRGATAGAITVTPELVGVPAAGAPLQPRFLPVELEVSDSSSGSRVIAKILLSLTYLAAEDSLGALELLLSDTLDLEPAARSGRVLALAAYVSMAYGGHRAVDIANRMLELTRPESRVVDAGILALVAAQVRYERARARKAVAKVEQVAGRLLLFCLREDTAAGETWYNLGRQAMVHLPRAALEFYGRLGEIDPSYDERWYYHRDIGSIYYSLSRLDLAAIHYDLAVHQKPDDSELLRYAGDAYYYQGDWAAALLRYEGAIGLEKIERCFLDGKVELARRRVGSTGPVGARFRRRRRFSIQLSRLGITLFDKWPGLADVLLSWAVRVSELNFDAHRFMALRANRNGAYVTASECLRRALRVLPEDPSSRLNLVVNLIFAADGQLTPAAAEQARIAIFHGGPETRARFRVRLAKTWNRDDLCTAFDKIYRSVERERAEWVERRRIVLKPQQFGRTMHVEIR